MNNPTVSVVMSVFNGDEFLCDAIESILNQTFTDFEFIIIDDGSTDQSLDIMKSYNDNRIQIIKNDNNLGLPVSLNKGIKIAKGEYIARMDCDDISLPTRLGKQVRFMDSNRNIGMSGTQVEYFGMKQGFSSFSTDPEFIKCSLLFRNKHLAHPTVIMRKELLEKYNLHYNSKYFYSQDTDLWCRLCSYTLLTNLPEVLLKYRVGEHNNKLNLNKKKMKLHFAKEIAKHNLNLLGINATEKELINHVIISRGPLKKSKDNIVEFEKWLKIILENNKKKNIYQKDGLSKIVAERWFSICYASSDVGPYIWWHYIKSPLPKTQIPSMLFIKFFIKSLIGIFK